MQKAECRVAAGAPGECGAQGEAAREGAGPGQGEGARLRPPPGAGPTVTPATSEGQEEVARKGDGEAPLSVPGRAQGRTAPVTAGPGHGETAGDPAPPPCPLDRPPLSSVGWTEDPALCFRPAPGLKTELGPVPRLVVPAHGLLPEPLPADSLRRGSYPRSVRTRPLDRWTARPLSSVVVWSGRPGLPEKTLKPEGCTVPRPPGG